MAFLSIPFLVGEAANLFQNGKVVVDGVYRIPLLFHGESLVVVDELLRQLTESQVLDPVPGFDELSEYSPHIVVAGISPFGTVYADTRLYVVTDDIGHFWNLQESNAPTALETIKADVKKAENTYYDVKVVSSMRPRKV